MVDNTITKLPDTGELCGYHWVWAGGRSPEPAGFVFISNKWEAG